MPWKLLQLMIDLSNGSFPGIPLPVPPSAPNPVISTSDVRKQQATEDLNQIVERVWLTYPEGRISYTAGAVPPSSSQLDSHANMRVFGKYCFIISKSGKEAIINAFTNQVGTITVPIFDAAVVYDCPWYQTTYILIASNILSVSSTDHNLIPPFILREFGLTVNDTAIIHLN